MSDESDRERVMRWLEGLETFINTRGDLMKEVMRFVERDFKKQPPLTSDLVEEAMRLRVRVRFTYQKWEGMATETKTVRWVRPSQINDTSFGGYDYDREEFRQFRFERASGMTLEPLSEDT